MTSKWPGKASGGCAGAWEVQKKHLIVWRALSARQMHEISGKEAKNEIARLDGLEMAWKSLRKVRGGRGRAWEVQKKHLWRNSGSNQGPQDPKESSMQSFSSVLRSPN